MAAKLKKGDKVVVLAGKDKGKEGEISRVLPKDGKAIVDIYDTNDDVLRLYFITLDWFLKNRQQPPRNLIQEE